jgi:hypothetical protein
MKIRAGVAFMALALAVPCAAIFVNAGQPVPLERLYRNVGALIQKNPKDPDAHYTLGRLHSLAFAREAQKDARVTRGNDAEKLPGFPPFEGVQIRPMEPGKASDEALKHLGISIQEYTRATELDPRRSLFQLGLGWMLEQGVPYADRTPAPWLNPPKKAPAADWQQRSLDAYRKAYAMDRDKDLKSGHQGPYADSAISLEAGEGILRLLKDRADEPSRTETAEVKVTVDRLAKLPRAITPIVFPLEGKGDLASLLTDRQAAFDLPGVGRAQNWPWVNGRAGILVWDPERTGRITSGVQLFGSVTWSMFWSDGYAPLAALDDNRDGRLTGRELRGLAVWRDANGNGVSEPGEVQPVSAYEIVSIACRASGSGAAGPYNEAGIQFRDGHRLPSYDWIPVSVPESR